MRNARRTVEGDRPWRGRRRRRDGRRGFPDAKFARHDRPQQQRETPEAAPAPAPAYEPIILPGESISKYQNRPQQMVAPPTTRVESERDGAGPGTEAAALAASTESLPSTLHREYEEEQDSTVESHDISPWTAAWPSQATGSRDTERNEEFHAAAEPERETKYDRMNVAAIFGGQEAETEETEEHVEEQHEPEHEEYSAHSAPSFAPVDSQPHEGDASFTPGEGLIEEEEIEEDENELPSLEETSERIAEYEDLEEEHTLDREATQRPEPKKSRLPIRTEAEQAMRLTSPRRSRRRIRRGG